MIIYRPHAETLEESMEEAKEFNDISEMKKYIVQRYHRDYEEGTFFDIDDIVIEDKTTKDDRIGWEDMRKVCLKRWGKLNLEKEYGCPQCIGNCATKYIK